jgi:predicted methyltransferase
MLTRRIFAVLGASLVLTACASSPPPAPAPVALNASQVDLPPREAAKVVLAQTDRAPTDRAEDGPREAADVLAYLDVRPGSNVGFLAPGSGYYLELVARYVGPSGRLFARNPPSLVERQGLAQAWEARLHRPAAARVARIDAELGTLLPVTGLDLVYLGYEFDGLKRAGVDSAAVITSSWNALRSGGRFVVVDRMDAFGAGPAQHQIESAGFRFASIGQFLKSGVTPADWGPGSGDYVLRTFVKP